MSLDEYAHLLSPELSAALERKGYSELTAVQKAVLDPELAMRDLRISSQTGSGKTVAIGFTLRALLHDAAPAQPGAARPRALVIAPTRELALQVEDELRWLFADAGVRVASTTGGASYRHEQRALSKAPGIVVGTPGRLLDHLKRGSIDTSQVAAIVLDEADRMLDLGFREDLEAIFELAPAERVTHLVSATFPSALRRLADRVQRDPRAVEGTALGEANSDIDHVIHIVDMSDRLGAIINLLLAHPEDQTLVFVRTRADTAELASALVSEGFAASALSGEMEQAARNRALAAFRQGAMRILVATDVAARGIDVQSVTRVIHAELPTDPDAYTHRSGRTGRAGRKGVSALLVSPAAVVRATRLLRGLGAPHRFEPIPTPEEIRQAQDDAVFAQLTAESEACEDERAVALALRLMAVGSVERTLARLLVLQLGGAKPREVRAFKERPTRERSEAGGRPGRDRRERPRSDRGFEDRPRSPRERAARGEAAAAGGGARLGRERPEGARARDDVGRNFETFRVSWGRQRGADARRVLAMVCRRGNIRGADVGQIRIEQNFSIIGVDAAVAEAFERSASEPDAREPHVIIRRAEQAASASQPSAAKPAPNRFKREKAGERPLKRRTR